MMNYKSEISSNYSNFYQKHGNVIQERIKFFNEEEEDDDVDINDQFILQNAVESINNFKSFIEADDSQSINCLKFVIQNVKKCNKEIIPVFFDNNFAISLINLFLKHHSIELRTLCIQLIWYIQDTFPIFLSYFWDANLVDALFETINQKPPIKIMTYCIFSVNNFLFQFKEEYHSKFESFLSVELMYNIFKSYESSSPKILAQLFKGLLSITQKISEFPLNQNDTLSAINLITILANTRLVDLFYLGLRIILNMAETHSFQYEDFIDTQLDRFVYHELTNGSNYAKVIACDILCYFIDNGHNCSFICADDILDNIDNKDQMEASNANIKLLATLIKNDQPNGGYIELIVTPHDNNYDVATICVNIVNGGFETMTTSAHCLLDIFEKVHPSLMIHLVQHFVVEALVYILGWEDDDYIIHALVSLKSLFDFAHSINEFDNVMNMALKYNIAEELMVLLDSENETVVRLSTNLQEYIGIDLE
ncbi:hypothetical protein TRFO_04951 [Tritrichomonas foetus]|uniref:Uncharacterized protein n=1 Tax=Tritrichomonas foetus TaxID=1144522 RepID=A0A1J4KA78_9EUKA|nr:hypothetical protein TRFO_04951 [Tritrichomonas foetus]|eukprot:OHT08327.1 hypothetical protein TRFO_04951 [Tritrichomonas foetus]